MDKSESSDSDTCGELPYLELRERQDVWTGKENAPVHMVYKGQLKLSVYMNHGLLTINIIQSRHLRSKWKENCNSYVRLSLVPDSEKRTRCKTDVVPASNKPLFDQKFSFEILEADREKRLFISSWHRDEDHSKSELLGCMSFGVKHLLNKGQTVSGWYHLLTESLGRRKHLRVVCAKVSAKKKNIPEVNSECMFMDPICLSVRKGDYGLGFSVAGSCPCQVGKVDPGSPASAAGLKEGDFIVRVNNHNVSRSTGDSVIRILRHSKGCVKIDVQRPSEVVKLQESPRKLVKHGAMTTTKGFKCGVDKADPEPAVAIESCQKVDGRNSASWEKLSKRSNSSEGTMGSGRKCVKHEEKMSVGVVVPDWQVAPSGVKVKNDEYQVHYNKVHPSAFHSFIMNCEQDYINTMQCGIQRFSRPLRHHIISPHEYTTLFQNVEKLVAISECHHKQLSELNPSQVQDYNIVMEIYLPKVQLLCNAYKDYCIGLSAARHLLMVLQQYPEFISFIKEQSTDSGQLDIVDFIERPKHHVMELAHRLTSLDPSEVRHSQQMEMVLDCLTSCCETIVEREQKPSWDPLLSPPAPLPSPDSAQQLQQNADRPPQLSTKSLTSVQSGVSVVSTVDQEVLDIQRQLLFDTNVPVFQLHMSGRHLIYTGEITKCDSLGHHQVKGLLFSDLLVLCRQEPDGFLTVVDSPVDLRSVTKVDSHRHNATELRLTYINDEHRHGTLTLRASTPELMHAWTHVIQLRISITTDGQKNAITNGYATNTNDSKKACNTATTTTAESKYEKSNIIKNIETKGCRVECLDEATNQKPVKVLPNWRIIHEMLGSERVVDQLVVGFGAECSTIATVKDVATMAANLNNADDALHNIQTLKPDLSDRVLQNLTNRYKTNTRYGSLKLRRPKFQSTDDEFSVQGKSKRPLSQELTATTDPDIRVSRLQNFI